LKSHCKCENFVKKIFSALKPPYLVNIKPETVAINTKKNPSGHSFHLYLLSKVIFNGKTRPESQQQERTENSSLTGKAGSPFPPAEPAAPCSRHHASSALGPSLPAAWPKKRKRKIKPDPERAKQNVYQKLLQ